jgi:hypothetical protein
VTYGFERDPVPQGENQKQDVVLWDPEQPEFGPVYHVMVNFQRLPTKFECLGLETCPHCKATRIYTRYLRTLEEERHGIQG